MPDLEIAKLLTDAEDSDHDSDEHSTAVICKSTVSARKDLLRKNGKIKIRFATQKHKYKFMLYTPFTHNQNMHLLSEIRFSHFVTK